MSEKVRRSIKRLAGVVTMLFALIGAYATYGWARYYAASPHHFAKPYSFVILDFENPKDPQTTTRIYLDSPSFPKDLRFEGQRLIYRAVDRPHPQSAVALPGFVLSGEGRVVFGSAALDLKDGEVQLNGLDLCRREVVISRSGEIWQGMLRIAH